LTPLSLYTPSFLRLGVLAIATLIVLLFFNPLAATPHHPSFFFLFGDPLHAQGIRKKKKEDRRRSSFLSVHDAKEGMNLGMHSQ
jgi:hypothetical protein